MNRSLSRRMNQSLSRQQSPSAQSYRPPLIARCRCWGVAGTLSRRGRTGRSCACEEDRGERPPARACSKKRGALGRPRGPPECPRNAPGTPQERPRSAPERPRAPQERPGGHDLRAVLGEGDRQDRGDMTAELGDRRPVVRAPEGLMRRFWAILLDVDPAELEVCLRGQGSLPTVLGCHLAPLGGCPSHSSWRAISTSHLGRASLSRCKAPLTSEER